jgi:hypothetical protein
VRYRAALHPESFKKSKVKKDPLKIQDVFENVGRIPVQIGIRYRAALNDYYKEKDP